MPTAARAAPPVNSMAHNSTLMTMVGAQTRFNFNDYMKGLNDKLKIAAPSTQKMSSTGF